MPSENGWNPARLDAGSDKLVWITVPGTNVSLQTMRGTPQVIMGAVAADFNAYIEPLRDPDSASYTPTNSVATSNHLNGTAMDLNWDSHPFRKRGTFTATQMATIRELLDFYEGWIFWAGDWDDPIDEMHWQMGYTTFGRDASNFIARKIRPDGFSTFRRGTTAVNTADILSHAMGQRLTLDRYRQLLPAVAASLIACQCTTVERISMWCAQIGHESGGLYYTEEIASGQAYEGRADLGNTKPGDGVRFKGRSWIQITGRSNYTRLSAWAYEQGHVPDPDVFVAHPERLAADEYAGLGAAWYWTVARPDINALADRRDLEMVTRRINGGLNGIDDRRRRYNQALSMGNQLLTLIGGGEDMSPELEQMIRDIHRVLFEPVASQSIYATPDEGPRWRTYELVRNGDGMLHPMFVESAARLGDFTELARVARTAAGQGVNTDPHVVARARNLLAEIGDTNPAMLRAFLAAQNGATK